MARQAARFTPAGFLGMMLLLTSCASFSALRPQSTQIPGPVITACEHPAIPDFLECVFPGPGMMVSFKDYTRLMDAPMALGAGVGIELDGIRVVEVGETLTKEEIGKRVSLAIDGRLISNDMRRWVDHGSLVTANDDQGRFAFQVERGPHWIEWYERLLPGQHQTTVNIRKGSGEVLTFSWGFIVQE